MSNKEEDYRQLGLKIGFEIHQRLDTKKLFCECLTEQKEKENAWLTRKMRPVVGELGNIDPAALHEFFRNKEFVYKLYPNESCLVEADEEPPHELNKEALEMALKIAKMLGCDIPDEVHVMRKTVIDGSNTGGFQRTAIVGMNGLMETKHGKIAIENVSLEEEAARIETEENEKKFYKLNGLGIPLIEIGTAATITSPQEAHEAALMLGTMLRTCKVKRGIGTIRQDVNVSIREGSRVEIKGFQEINDMPLLIRNEIQRQKALIEIKGELKTRGIKSFEPPRNVTNIFKNTECNIIEDIIAKGGKVLAIKLANFKGIMKKECGGKSFGKELAHYAMAFGTKGVIHSEEELERYKLTNEFFMLKKELETAENDVIVIVAEKGENAEKAAHAVIERAKQLLIGVPKETRVALPDATSKFSRPLPGAERMYPETDVPPIPIEKKQITAMEMPETLEERKKKLLKHLPEELANQMLVSEYYEIYKDMTGFDPVLVATTLLSTIKDLKRQGMNINNIKKEHLKELFRLIKENRLAKSMMPHALEKLIVGKKLEEIIKDLEIIPEYELKKIVEKLLEKNKGLSMQAIMGIAMRETHGRAAGKTLAELIRKRLEKYKEKK